MKIYTEGVAPCGGGQAGYYQDAIKKHRPYILESFYYADETTEKLIPYFGDFMLDSGAFTFMQGTKGHVDWDEYIKRYADFINRNHVDKFFELDIDSVVGYKQVLRFRDKLESLTGKPCIPVWHKTRGIKEFQKMCDEMVEDNLGILWKMDVLKAVVRASDLPYLRAFLDKHSLKCPVYISPVYGEIQLPEIAEFIKEYHGNNNLRMQLQMHKFIWNPNERGV